MFVSKKKFEKTEKELKDYCNDTIRWISDKDKEINELKNEIAKLNGLSRFEVTCVTNCGKKVFTVNAFSYYFENTTVSFKGKGDVFVAIFNNVVSVIKI